MKICKSVKKSIYIYIMICTINRKYYLLFVFYRHAHFELSSILCQLNIVFGLQMMIQVALFHLSAAHFIITFYQFILSININTTYIFTINVISFFLWAAKCIIDLIVFNYICEEVCTKVKAEDSLENLRKRDKILI